jgi:hypothetical protein
MNPSQYREDWLSAYLDGELSEEQREVVESRLATDPTARATLEDLNRIRSMVAKLPAWNGPSLQFALPPDVLKTKTALATDHDSSDGIDSDEGNSEDSDANLIAVRQTPAPAEFEDVTSLEEDDCQSDPVSENRPTWNAVAHRFNLGWLAAAASILLMLGIGGLLWQPWARDLSMAGRRVESTEAQRNPDQDNLTNQYKMPANDTPGASSNSLSETLDSSYSQTEQLASGSTMKADSVQSELEIAMPQSRFHLETMDSPNEIVPKLNVAPPPGDRVANSSIADGSAQFGASVPETALGDLGGADLHREQQADPSEALSFNLPRRDGSAMPKLDEPSDVSSNAQVEEWTNAKDRQRASRLRMARGQSWSDQEIDQSLPNIAGKLGVSIDSLRSILVGERTVRLADHFSESTGSNGDIGLAGRVLADAQTETATETVQIMMAAIDGESPTSSVFESLIDLPKAKQRPTAGEQAVVESLGKEERLGDAQAELPPPAEAKTEKKATRQADPDIQSVVLFVSQTQADNILSQLKKQGAVKHNPWVIVPITPTAKLSDQKVILILSSPP